MIYTRLYSDAHGESHFEDVEIGLTLTNYAPPAPPLELSSFTAATQVGFMNAPAGWSSDWHPTSMPNIFSVLSGEWEVTASDGESRRFGVGSALRVEDTTGKGFIACWQSGWFPGGSRAFAGSIGIKQRRSYGFSGTMGHA